MPEQNDQIAKLLTDDSFLRWINGEATSAERKKWDQWLRKDPANHAVVRQAKELNQMLQFAEEQPDTLEELNKLEAALSEKEAPSQKFKPGNVINRQWMRVAAAIVLLLSVIAVARYATWETGQPQQAERPVVTTTETDYGEVKKLAFSDGSRVILNAHSKLTYLKTDKGGNMEVTLRGEAYFEITHKTGPRQRTFSVRTPEGKVTVLGTKFNVNTYSGNTEVVLEKGKVQLHRNDSLNAAKPGYMMRPGEIARITVAAGDIEIQSVDTELYTSWRNLELKFRDTPLHQIADRLEQIYGVEVQFRDQKLKEIKFSGSAPSKNIAVLLEGLRTLLNIPISQEGNIIQFG